MGLSGTRLKSAKSYPSRYEKNTKTDFLTNLADLQTFLILVAISTFADNF